MRVATALRASAPAAASRPSGRIGVWRTLAAAPAMIGSLAVLVVLFGWLDRFEALVLLGCLASGVAASTPAGERIALRVSCGLRRPSAAQTTALMSPWTAALWQTGTAAGDVDLYVQRCLHANAYAAGGRSVAVSSGLLQEYVARQLTEEQVVAVLVHELGHHATRAISLGVVSAWLAAPWRLATRLIIGFAQAVAAQAVAGRQPRGMLALAVCAGVGVAVGQTMSQRIWPVAAVLAGVGALSMICPLTDAALARREELAADPFAAHHGLALELTAALHAMDDGRSAARGRSQRLLASHPTLEQRIRALLAATAASRG